MADDLSLLFRLRAENTQAKAVLADTRAAVAQLRQAFGPQLTQTVNIANKSFSDIDGTLTNFVAQRVPLVGGALVRVTEGLKSVSSQGGKTDKAISSVASSIQSIATQSGKTVPQITNFLTRFVQLEGQSKRNEAAFKFFGGSVDLVGNKTAKFLPELEKASTALSEVSAESTTAGASIAGVAGAVGIAVIAIAALVAGAALAAKEIFNLAKAAADFQGKLFDLSQQTGVSVETLSALEVVARTTGSSIEALTQSLGIFQKHLEEAAEDADSKAGKAFKKLGVDATDTEAALRQTIAALARMPEGFRQTSLALEVFGRGGKAFLAIAKESKGDIDEITRRLQGLGLVTTEQAKLADEFNDQLVILDVQMRGLGTKAIPVVLDVMKDLSEELEQNRDLFIALQGAVKGLATGISLPLRAAIGIIKTEFEKASLLIQLTTVLFERMASAIGFIAGHPITLPGFTTAPSTTTEPPKQAEPAKDPFTKQLEEQIAARKRLQGVLNFEFAQQQQQANAAIAQAQREFEAGKRTRESLLEATVDGIKKQTNAEIEGLKADRRIKLEEQALAKDDLEKRTQLSNAILAIDIQIAAKRSEIKQREKDERAKFQQEEINNEIAHQERLLARSRDLDQVNITGIQQQVALRKKAALDGDKEIENIELRAIDREQAFLVKRLEIAGKNLAKRKEIQDQIKALDTQRTATEQRHSAARLLIVETEADITLQLIETKGQALIATVEALAEQRVITEEEAARRIAKIRLDALDDEIELAKARGQDTRVLEAQREALQAETERNIEEGRQRDLRNEREYADDLEDIKERINRIQRDAARVAIELMTLNFARRKDIIKAQTDLELRESEIRHKAILDSIREDQSSNDARIRFLTNFIQALKDAGKTTSAEYQKAVEELRTANEKKAALHQEEISELEFSEAEKEAIKRRARLKEKDADEIGRISINLDDLKEFASVIEDSIVPLGEILTRTFQQVSDAIGQTVANWVLLGETGPAVMRKILAQALASIAAEAAVNAIKELALGFATLFFNPAESAAHFTAAGLWASIGGVAAIAGRSVAGDLFKTKTGSETGAGRSGGGGPGELNPLNLARNAGTGGQPQVAPQIQPTFRVVVSVAEGKFADAIKTTVVEDFNNAGPIREVIGGDGNLNRG